MIYKKKVKPNWDSIGIIQGKLEKKLKKHEKGYIDSVKMVTGELLENSIKYYMEKGKTAPLEFSFSNSKAVSISILNQEIEIPDIIPVVDLIEKISSSSDPYLLYISRLEEILENRIIGESKLGLLRVASDGGYSLSYILNNNKISISAVKNDFGEVKHMNKLVYEDLTIEVNDLETHVEVAWIGKCRTLNPEHILDTYLSQVCQYLIGKKAVVSFEKLESMNSSTVPPLLTFIKILDENSVNSTFIYDDNEDWQRASFKPLSVIASRYKNVVIKAKS